MPSRRAPSRLAPLVVLLGLLLGLIPSPARAADLALDLRMQLGGGGDTLASVTYSDGSTYDLNLGAHFGFAAGASWTPFALNDQAVVLTGLVGIGGWDTGPSNTDDRIGLTRFPLELLAFYRYGPASLPVQLQVGGGLTYHLVPGVGGSGAFDGLDIDVENALGWVVEAGVKWDGLVADVRYTRIRYVVGSDRVDLDGSSIALCLGVVLPIELGGAPADGGAPAAGRP